MMARFKQSSSNSLKTNFPVQLSEATWVKMPRNSTVLPRDAFVACLMETGEYGYIARGSVNGRLVSGHTTASGDLAFLPFGTSEHRVTDFEVLIAKPENLMWVKDEAGRTPEHSVKGGKDRYEQQYIGRTYTKLEDATTWQGLRLPAIGMEGKQRVGKIHKSHKCLYVPFDGKEYIFRKYEVLKHKVTPGKLTVICRWNLHRHFEGLELDASAINKLPLPESLKDYMKLK